jgi:hypothetical protein
MLARPTASAAIRLWRKGARLRALRIDDRFEDDVVAGGVVLRCLGQRKDHGGGRRPIRGVLDCGVLRHGGCSKNGREADQAEKTGHGSPYWRAQR